MTIIKQKSVTENGHAKNLRNYINDEKALLRSFQNIANLERWSDDMARIRKRFGHDKSARRNAANTIMYHQVLAFLCEEIDIYGGKMTPELCLEYAKEYAKTRYPDQQIAFALHKEHCEEDGTFRYAVHMAINRSNLVTHRRLDEGRSVAAKKDRAAFVRKMDEGRALRGIPQDQDAEDAGGLGAGHEAETVGALLCLQGRRAAHEDGPGCTEGAQGRACGGARLALAGRAAGLARGAAARGQGRQGRALSAPLAGTPGSAGPRPAGRGYPAAPEARS